MMCRVTHFASLGIVLIASLIVSSFVQADEGDDLYNLSLGLIRQERYETAAENTRKNWSRSSRNILEPNWPDFVWASSI